MEHFTSSPAETRALGAALAKTLRPGDIVGLEGDLGAGKTVFVQGMAEALGVAEAVVSPTFAVLCPYGGAAGFVHMDAYRLASADDLESVGFFDYLDGGHIIAVEWAGRIAAFLPDGVISVKIEQPGETLRRIYIEGGRL